MELLYAFPLNPSQYFHNIYRVPWQLSTCDWKDCGPIERISQELSQPVVQREVETWFFGLEGTWRCERAIVKSRTGRGRKCSEWLNSLQIDLLTDMKRMRKTGLKLSEKTLMYLSKHIFIVLFYKNTIWLWTFRSLLHTSEGRRSQKIISSIPSRRGGYKNS